MGNSLIHSCHLWKLTNGKWFWILEYVRLSSGLSPPLGQFSSDTDCWYSSLMTFGHLICVTCTESVTLSVNGSRSLSVNNTWKSLTRPIQVNKLSWKGCVSELFRMGSNQGVRVIRMQWLAQATVHRTRKKLSRFLLLKVLKLVWEL